MSLVGGHPIVCPLNFLKEGIVSGNVRVRENRTPVITSKAERFENVGKNKVARRCDVFLCCKTLGRCPEDSIDE